MRAGYEPNPQARSMIVFAAIAVFILIAGLLTATSFDPPTAQLPPPTRTARPAPPPPPKPPTIPTP